MTKTILLITIIYLIGSILSYCRAYASFYEIEEEICEIIKPEECQYLCLRISLLSWVTFLVGVMIKLVLKEKYWFKWSIRDLIKRYEQSNIKIDKIKKDY